MIDYFKKFISLPQELRDIVSISESMKIITALEKEYGVPLAQTAMKVMTKDLPVAGLAGYFQDEFKLEAIRAGKLAQELTIKIFQPASAYLGIGASGRASEKKSPKSLASSATAGFFFSPEDAKDISRQAAKISEFGDYSQVKKGINEKADEVADKFQINFSSAEIQDRFKKIIRTYIRNIRDQIDIKQALMKSIPDGGVGLDEEEARRVISTATAIKERSENHQFTQPEIIKIPKEEKAVSADYKKMQASGVRDVDYDFSALAKKKLDTTHELAPPPPVIRAKSSSIDSLATKLPTEPVSKAKPKPVTSVPASRAQALINRQPYGKKQMVDVKRMPLVMSPIDELKYLNLESFRRLSSAGKTAREKIVEIIDLLSKDGFDKKAEGIKAWRKSPVNKMYLNLGQEMVSQKQPINVIIEKKNNLGEKVLTVEEFKEIMEINKNISF